MRLEREGSAGERTHMIKKRVHFENMLEVADFVKISSGFPDEIKLIGDDYEADAKSMLGIFGMDISKPLCVLIHGSAAGERKVCAAMKQYFA